MTYDSDDTILHRASSRTSSKGGYSITLHSTLTDQAALRVFELTYILLVQYIADVRTLAR